MNEKRDYLLGWDSDEFPFNVYGTALEELVAYVENMGSAAHPGSGRQEYLEGVVNSILFCS